MAGLLPAAGCGGAAEDSGDGDGARDRPGDGDDNLQPLLDTTAHLTSLEERGQRDVCDNVARMYGGYGVVFECPDGVNTSQAPSEEGCLRLLATLPPECEATVDDLLRCSFELSTTCTTNDCGPFFACTR